MLTAEQSSALSAAVEQLRVAADQADAAKPGTITKWWDGFIGVDSTAAAVNADATATRNAYNLLSSQAADWSGSPDPVDNATIAQAVDFAASTSNIDSLKATANLLRVSTAAEDVGGATLHDAAGLASQTGSGIIALLPLVPYLLLVLVLLVIYRKAEA